MFTQETVCSVLNDDEICTILWTFENFIIKNIHALFLSKPFFIFILSKFEWFKWMTQQNLEFLKQNNHNIIII